jgi:hypothetical protein
VDQEQVEVVDVQRLQRALEGAERVVVRVEGVVQLAGHEDVATVDAGRPDRLADLLLVAVHLRGVDVPVAHLERRQGRVLGLLGLDLEHPEAELGDVDTVVQGDARYAGHGAPLRLRRRSRLCYLLPNPGPTTRDSGV